MADAITPASKLLEGGKQKIEEPTKYYRQPSQRKHEIEGGEKSLERSFSFKRSLKFGPTQIGQTFYI